MSAEEFRANAESESESESEKVFINNNCHAHAHVLRIAYIYLRQDLLRGNGVFDIVAKLHERGCSFGRGELRFNR